MLQVARFRKRKKLSQTALGGLVNANQATISKIEKGKISPSIEMVERLAKALGCQPYQLFDMPELQRLALEAIENAEPDKVRAAFLLLGVTLPGSPEA